MKSTNGSGQAMLSSSSSKRKGRSSRNPAGGGGAGQQPGSSGSAAQAGWSNRSSPEASPERSLLKPLTYSSSNGHSSSSSRSISPARTATASKTRRMSSKTTRPSHVYDETPTNEKLAYFGSNESEREISNADDDGDASSSEDSATDMLDAALGIPSSTASSSTMPFGTRRELLVQRPVVESSQSSWESWEHALLHPKRVSPRPRSLTPQPSSSLASRRRGSPAANALQHDLGPSLSPPLFPRSPSPSAASSPAARSMPPRWYHLPFRVDLLAEVLVLTLSLIIAAYRMQQFRTPFDAEMRKLLPIPLSPLVMLLALIPGVALFRPKTIKGSYMFPFTDERGYRTPATVDDGFAAGATIPVLLAAGFLWDGVRAGRIDADATFGGIGLITDVWQSAGLIPNVQHNHEQGAVHRTVIIARISLLLSTSINTFILILHILLSRTVLRVERLPTNNTKRLFGALGLSSLVSFTLWTLLAINHRFAWASPYIKPSEAAISSFIYQMSLYTVSRLVRRGFTLGELSLATGAGISLALEFWRLTKARLFYVKYAVIPATFRMPTPLVPFQTVMIPGAFVTGFLLAPLLVLSRNYAQRPSHRFKKPEERGKYRKLIAAGVGSSLFLIVTVPYGGWAGWTLGGNLLTPWTWGLRFLLSGGNGVPGSEPQLLGWRRWKRVFLALYWLAIVTSAVGGWQTRLVRARRFRLAKSKAAQKGQEGATNSVVDKAAIAAAGIANVREDRRMHVALDLRRKFFHALAVLMFVPAIAIDPAFTSLAFSIAFAIFTFAEYARFFAVYPIGAPIHVFFSEFIDSKDAGPVILSHFYLLTGCAGGLWLEGRGIMNYTGVLAVGVGDAFASVLGKRLGQTKWPYSNKTVFGTASFVLSIFGAAMLLRVTGVVEPFSASRYLLATIMAGLLEAVSAQNDNLIIPIFFWSLLSLLEV